MTQEEAINNIKFLETQICVRECQSHRGYWGECDFCKDMETLDSAIEALRRRVPRKPIIMHKFGLDDGYHLPVCYRCGERVDGTMKYCPNCGQRQKFD